VIAFDHGKLRRRGIPHPTPLHHRSQTFLDKPLGSPLSALEWRWNRYVQLYQYGVLMIDDGIAVVMPSGDALLHARGWLPAAGASDAFPVGMSSTPLPIVSAVTAEATKSRSSSHHHRSRRKHHA